MSKSSVIGTPFSVSPLSRALVAGGSSTVHLDCVVPGGNAVLGGYCENDTGTVGGQIYLDAGGIRVSVGGDARDCGMGVGGGGSDDDGSGVMGNVDPIGTGGTGRLERGIQRAGADGEAAEVAVIGQEALGVGLGDVQVWLCW